MNTANPKVLLFYTAIVPQFVNPHEAVAPQMLILGVTGLSVGAVISAGYALMAARMARRLAGPRYATITNRITGSLLIAAGRGWRRCGGSDAAGAQCLDCHRLADKHRDHRGLLLHRGGARKAHIARLPALAFQDPDRIGEPDTLLEIELHDRLERKDPADIACLGMAIGDAAPAAIAGFRQLGHGTPDQRPQETGDRLGIGRGLPEDVPRRQLLARLRAFHGTAPASTSTTWPVLAQHAF
jgi:hypothetical protein